MPGGWFFVFYVVGRLWCRMVQVAVALAVACLTARMPALPLPQLPSHLVAPLPLAAAAAVQPWRLFAAMYIYIMFVNLCFVTTL